MISFLRGNLKVVALVLVTSIVWFIGGYFNRICTSLRIPAGISPGVDYFPELSYQCTVAKFSNWMLAALILVTLVFIGMRIARGNKLVGKNQ